jgi:hypothetical protein
MNISYNIRYYSSRFFFLRQQKSKEKSQRISLNNHLILYVLHNIRLLNIYDSIMYIYTKVYIQ